MTVKYIVEAASATIGLINARELRLKPLLRLFLSVLMLYPMTEACAHEMRPGLLDIRERSSGWFEVIWKVPTRPLWTHHESHAQTRFAVGNRVAVPRTEMEDLGPASSVRNAGRQTLGGPDHGRL